MVADARLGDGGSSLLFSVVMALGATAVGQAGAELLLDEGAHLH